MASPCTPDFELFTSLRYDPQLLQSDANTALGASSPFYMLPFHLDRILSAANHFEWPKIIALLSAPEGYQIFQNAIESRIDLSSTTPLRVRVAVGVEGNISVTSGPTPPKKLGNLFPSMLLKPGEPMVEVAQKDNLAPSRADEWRVMIDPQRTEPSPFTNYKTSKRSVYDAARARAGIATMTEPKEVLLISTEGKIMEGSLTSIILWRGGRWVTPPVSSGGQGGTTRRWLITEGQVEEEELSVDSLEGGEECWLSNGVRGMIPGRIMLNGEKQSRQCTSFGA